MGWAPSLWICQTIHEIVASRVPGVTADRQLVDGLPAPVIGDSFVRAEYVDNFVGLARKPGVGKQAAERVRAEMNRVGLPTHDVTHSVGGETLGWLFEERLLLWF